MQVKKATFKNNICETKDKFLLIKGTRKFFEPKTVIQFPKEQKRLVLLPEKHKSSVFHTDNCILAVLRPSQQVLRIQLLNYWNLPAVLRPSQQVGENTSQRPKLLFISINDQFAVLRPSAVLCARRGRSQQVLSWKDY
ncbi:hypothetical protein ACFL1G_05585 [Planctomycetota bacterium]